MSVTQVLAQFIVNGTYNDLPEAAVVAAKRGILDFIAVTLAGSCEPVAQKVQDYARQTNCSDQATVMNGKFKTSACLAALVNGAMAHAMDYDDVIHVPPFWLGHPSVAILPAVLAVAEMKDLSGQAVVLASWQGLET